ncbi:MAG TPA: hypothetical protein VGR57_01470 [Ktedonobacterales bacterium]|nr:hypothetical protein [Ktedonobacterales bacterium]
MGHGATMVYIGDLEAVTTSGSTATRSDYHYAGKLLAEAVNCAVSLLATTAQGSVAAALSASGTTTVAQLDAPNGTSRYASWTMPTDHGDTGQRADTATPPFGRRN